MSMISDNTAEQLIYDLVAIASPSREEANASQFLVDWMTQHGYDKAFVDEAGNAVGIIGTGEREIVLLGHIDTFPGFPEVHIDGRNLYGRGSVDAKGPLCTFAAAAQRAKLNDNVRVVVIGAVEEEAATSKGAHYAVNQYSPDFCVIGEPSHWDRITLGYKGRLLLDWRWEGGMSHSAGDALSPAEHAINYWMRVKHYADTYNTDINSIFAKFDATVRDINTRLDGVNGIAEMTVGFRLPPNIVPQDIVDQFPPTDGATVTPRGSAVAFTGDKNSELSRYFRRAIRASEGKPRFLYKTGTADMNVVGPIWNCPIVAYGPGDSALDHTPHEHLELDEYLSAIRVLTHVLEAI
jgi:[amino group carrier protein]-lysine/ornithine hydrolase